MNDDQRREHLYDALTDLTRLLVPDRGAERVAPLSERVASWESHGPTTTGADGVPLARRAGQPRAAHQSAGQPRAAHRVEADEPAALDPFGEWRGVDAARRVERLEQLGAEVGVCMRCPLAPTRTHAVPGEGVIDPLVMVIGEGPGADEDRTGRPFVGRAGRFLDEWLGAVGLSREENVFVANIVKCRPPENRDPQPEEVAACMPYLEEQIALVQPRMILCLGRVATRSLTGVETGITRIHGTFYTWRGITVVPTFHPSAVLRNEAWKRPVWEDLKCVRNWLIDHAGHTTGRS